MSGAAEGVDGALAVSGVAEGADVVLAVAGGVGVSGPATVASEVAGAGLFLNASLLNVLPMLGGVSRALQTLLCGPCQSAPNP